jgi:hypothetical protein
LPVGASLMIISTLRRIVEKGWLGLFDPDAPEEYPL